MDRPIRKNNNGKYNLNFIDWNNEWERVCEVERMIENGVEIEEKEEEERVRNNMNKEKEKFGITIESFPMKPPVKGKECYICLKMLSVNKLVRTLPCNHQFCHSCLMPWLKHNHVCPTCKYKLKDEDEHEENFDEY